MSVRLHPLVPVLASLGFCLGCTAGTGALGSVSVISRLSAPVPLISLQAPFAVTDGSGGSTVRLALNRPRAFVTQAASVSLTVNDVTYYRIELIQDQAGSSLASANYGNSVVSPLGSVLLRGSSLAPTITTGGSMVLADGGAVGRMAFVNVPPGTYRIRVRAKTNVDATVDVPADDANKPDSFFVQSSGWEISDGTATVTLGSSTVSYAGPGSSLGQLDVALHLKDPGDEVPVTLTVTPGAYPAVTSNDT